MYHNFLLQYGYAEGMMMASLPVSHRDGFETIPKALKSLTEHTQGYLKAQISVKPCCQRNKDQGFYCCTCGSKFENVFMSSEDVSVFFERLLCSDMGNHRHLEYMRTQGWYIGRFKNSTLPICFVDGFVNYLDDNGGWYEGIYPDGSGWTCADG